MATRGRPKKTDIENIETEFLSTASSNLMSNINIDNMDILGTNNAELYNLSNNKDKINNIKEDSDILAKNLLENIMKSYVTDTDIYNKNYIQDKMKIDKILLSSLIFQLNINNIAVKEIMDETRGGNSKSTFYMSLASLEKSKIEIIKQIDSFLYNVEISYKSISENQKSEKKKSENNNESSDNNFRNTKDMLKNVLNDDNSATK